MPSSSPDTLWIWRTSSVLSRFPIEEATRPARASDPRPHGGRFRRRGSDPPFLPGGPMATTQQREQDKNREIGEQQRRRALVRGQVIRTLGTPGDLYDVQVRSLWDDNYRVNIL